MKLSELTSSLIKKEIIALATHRFVVDDEGLSGSVLEEITPDSLNDSVVISLKRDWPNSIGRRTLLVTTLESQDRIKNALQWAASVKDELTEPENGDIYLFIAVKDEQMSVEQCTAIEANDRICRRYVLRPSESIADFLGRSFIAPVMGTEKTTGISDPLHLALEKTGERHTWFNNKEQQAWRKAFLSGKSATEIINSLFK
jgi:hypothetical protein